MVIFYWVMGSLVVLTLLPSALYMLLYAFTGEEACASRARAVQPRQGVRPDGLQHRRLGQRGRRPVEPVALNGTTPQ
jgi:hypothetical protein